MCPAKKAPKKVRKKAAKKAAPTQGRPTKYRAEMCERAYEMRLAGHTLENIAAMLGVCTAQLYVWREKHPTFAEALERGSAALESRCFKAAVDRATGMRVTEVKRTKGEAGGEVVSITEKDLPPDMQASKLVLGALNPERYRERYEHQHSGDVQINVITGVPRAPDDPIAEEDATP